jgi:ribosomal protein S18 acetylase RimI-like enzyme
MAFNNIKIQRATIADLENLVVLFKKYMLFYKKTATTDKVRNFLEKRIKMGEATVLIAYSEESDQNPLAFVLLYPGFSSLSLGKIYILNDLYVEEYARRSGIARKLIDASRDLAKKENVIRLDLSTANNNQEAQKLYELYGFKKDEIFSNYSYSLN